MRRAAAHLVVLCKRKNNCRGLRRARVVELLLRCVEKASVFRKRRRAFRVGDVAKMRFHRYAAELPSPPDGMASSVRHAAATGTLSGADAFRYAETISGNVGGTENVNWRPKSERYSVATRTVYRYYYKG